MMTKQELLKLIQDLPDDVEVVPFEFRECNQEAGDWESQHRNTNLGGVYQRTVENEITLRLKFRTRTEGEFRRTYENTHGMFFNLRRIG